MTNSAQPGSVPTDNGLPRILVSACLLGQPVRYDGGHKAVQHPVLQDWLAQGLVISSCPEAAGGLPTPRPAAEIVVSPPAHGSAGMAVLQGQARVLGTDGADVSAAFRSGADQALALAREHGIRLAVLKQSSPSCGSLDIYDGSFGGRRIAGQGVTAALLSQAGIAIFDEQQWDEAHACWLAIKHRTG